MTIYEALDIFENYFKEAVKGDKFPTAIQKGDIVNEDREPDLYKMRLPHANDAKKLAPYIIVRYVNGLDKQEIGREAKSSITFRFIFTIYDSDEMQGALNLLNLMDKMRIRMLKDIVIGGKLKLIQEDGLEMFVYEDDTAPYFAGEIIGTFKIGPVEREVYLNGEIY